MNTKEKLIESTKEELKEYGLLNAQLNRITSRIGVKPPLFSYHLKNLSHAISEIMMDFHYKIRNELEKHNIDNPLTFFFCFTLLVNRISYGDPFNRRFYYEYYSDKGKTTIEINPEISNLFLPFYDSIFKYYKVQIDRESLDMLYRISSAANKDMVLYLYTMNMAFSKENLINYIDLNTYYGRSIPFKYSDVPDEEIDRCFNEAVNIVNSIDTTAIPFL